MADTKSSNNPIIVLEKCDKIIEEIQLKKFKNRISDNPKNTIDNLIKFYRDMKGSQTPAKERNASKQDGRANEPKTRTPPHVAQHEISNLKRCLKGDPKDLIQKSTRKISLHGEDAKEHEKKSKQRIVQNKTKCPPNTIIKPIESMRNSIRELVADYRKNYQQSADNLPPVNLKLKRKAEGNLKGHKFSSKYFNTTPSVFSESDRKVPITVLNDRTKVRRKNKGNDVRFNTSFEAEREKRVCVDAHKKRAKKTSTNNACLVNNSEKNGGVNSYVNHSKLPNCNSPRIPFDLIKYTPESMWRIDNVSCVSPDYNGCTTKMIQNEDASEGKLSTGVNDSVCNSKSSNNAVKYICLKPKRNLCFNKNKNIGLSNRLKHKKETKIKTSFNDSALKCDNPGDSSKQYFDTTFKTNRKKDNSDIKNNETTKSVVNTNLNDNLSNCNKNVLEDNVLIRNSNDGRDSVSSSSLDVKTSHSIAFTGNIKKTEDIHSLNGGVNENAPEGNAVFDTTLNARRGSINIVINKNKPEGMNVLKVNFYDSTNSVIICLSNKNEHRKSSVKNTPSKADQKQSITLYPTKDNAVSNTNLNDNQRKSITNSNLNRTAKSGDSSENALLITKVKTSRRKSFILSTTKEASEENAASNTSLNAKRRKSTDFAIITDETDVKNVSNTNLNDTTKIDSNGETKVKTIHRKFVTFYTTKEKATSNTRLNANRRKSFYVVNTNKTDVKNVSNTSSNNTLKTVDNSKTGTEKNAVSDTKLILNRRKGLNLDRNKISEEKIASDTNNDDLKQCTLEMNSREPVENIILNNKRNTEIITTSTNVNITKSQKLKRNINKCTRLNGSNERTLRSNQNKTDENIALDADFKDCGRKITTLENNRNKTVKSPDFDTEKECSTVNCRKEDIKEVAGLISSRSESVPFVDNLDDRTEKLTVPLPGKRRRSSTAIITKNDIDQNTLSSAGYNATKRKSISTNQNITDKEIGEEDVLSGLVDKNTTLDSVGRKTKQDVSTDICRVLRSQVYKQNLIAFDTGDDANILPCANDKNETGRSPVLKPGSKDKKIKGTGMNSPKNMQFAALSTNLNDSLAMAKNDKTQIAKSLRDSNQKKISDYFAKGTNRDTTAIFNDSLAEGGMAKNDKNKTYHTKTRKNGKDSSQKNISYDTAVNGGREVNDFSAINDRLAMPQDENETNRTETNRLGEDADQKNINVAFGDGAVGERHKWNHRDDVLVYIPNVILYPSLENGAKRQNSGKARLKPKYRSLRSDDNKIRIIRTNKLARRKSRRINGAKETSAGADDSGAFGSMIDEDIAAVFAELDSCLELDLSPGLTINSV